MLYDDLSDIQRDVYHALHSLQSIGRMIVAKHNDIEVWNILRDWAAGFAKFIIEQNILSESELEEVMIYGSEQEKVEQDNALNEMREMLTQIMQDDENNPLGEMLRQLLATNPEDNPNMPYDQELEDLFNAPAYGENEEDNS